MGWRSATLAMALGASAVPAAGVLTTVPAACDGPAGRLAVAAHAAGLPADKVATAVAIGLAESGGDPLAVGDVDLVDGKWGPSVGVFQVRSLHAERGTGGVRDELALTDLGRNARSMVAVSGAGTDWRPWSVYASGAYLARMPEGEAAASCAGTASVTAARPDAAELLNRAVTNVVYGVGDRACPSGSTADLCSRWRAFTAGEPGVRAVPTAAGMVTVEGMTVAAEAAPSLRRMLAAARSDGVELSAVSSLRTADEQAALRRQNCPDPVSSPAVACTPATAKVGTSEHETGHAVDFAPGSFTWLEANASRFGFAATVPSEPWHFSYVGEST